MQTSNMDRPRRPQSAGARPHTPTPTTASRPSFGDYHPDDHVSRPIAAALMAVSPRTTEDWARDGKGPAFRKLGTGRSARIVYRVGDLLEWLNAQARSSTTNDPEAG